MPLKTYDEWKAAGFQVQKGQKAKQRSERGALFSKEQVKPASSGGWDKYQYTDEHWDSEGIQQWYDEYGHTRDWY